MEQEVLPKHQPTGGRPPTNPLVSLIRDSSGLERVIYALLVFIPLAFIAEFAHFDSTLVFFFSCLGITPLAKIMGTATEELAVKTGSGIGGLLNATFGNAVELIIAIFALLEAQREPQLLEVVKASITGSLVGNLLFVLGLAILVGGWKREKQTFNATATRSSNTLLTLTAIALIMPAVFAFTLSTPTTAAQQTDQTNLLEALSIGVAIILILSYAAQLLFSLRTHAFLFGGSSGEMEEADESHGWSARASILVLVGATVLVGFMAEFLVGSVEALTKGFGWTELFVGAILIAIIGNAAEHLTAVIVAMKNKMDLAIGIAVGSSTQVAAFVAPVLVLVGFLLGGGSRLNLIFSPFELVAIILSIFIVNVVANDGESNWLEGVQLLAAYLIIAIAFYLHPPLAPAVPLPSAK
ncbi:MAG TPA: calcium/proton exchanger [Chloroflexia bacterium]|nr:calcium/proton exchanger [Chloroflexia bacterium]